MPHCSTKSENRKKKQIEKYTRRMCKYQRKIEKYTGDRCPHTGSLDIKRKSFTIESTKNGIPPGKYTIKTCCDNCRGVIEKSLNESGKNSPYFGGMENNCIRLIIGPDAEKDNGQYAQRACPTSQ